MGYGTQVTGSHDTILVFLILDKIQTSSDQQFNFKAKYKCTQLSNYFVDNRTFVILNVFMYTYKMSYVQFMKKM